MSKKIIKKFNSTAVSWERRKHEMPSSIEYHKKHFNLMFIRYNKIDANKMQELSVEYMRELASVFSGVKKIDNKSSPFNIHQDQKYLLAYNEYLNKFGTHIDFLYKERPNDTDLTIHSSASLKYVYSTGIIQSTIAPYHVV